MRVQVVPFLASRYIACSAHISFESPMRVDMNTHERGDAGRHARSQRSLILGNLYQKPGTHG